MIKRNGTRVIPIVLIAGLTLVFFAVVLHAVLVARVHHQARADVQSAVRDFIQFSDSHEVDSADSLLTEFIEQHPVNTDETLVGITPGQLIQSDWVQHPLDSGDALVEAATESPGTVGVVEETEGPVYWASVEIEATDSSLLVARFTGMDIRHTTGLVRMVVSLTAAGVTLAGMLWWFFPRIRKTPQLVAGELGTVGKTISEHSGLEFAPPPDPQVIVQVDAPALGTALKAAADFCRATEAGMSIQDHTVTLWVHSPDTQLTSQQLNATFDSPDMRRVLDISQQHSAPAWVESAPGSGCTIGIDLPIQQERRNHAYQH